MTADMEEVWSVITYQQNHPTVSHVFAYTRLVTRASIPVLLYQFIFFRDADNDPS